MTGPSLLGDAQDVRAAATTIVAAAKASLVSFTRSVWRMPRLLPLWITADRSGVSGYREGVRFRLVAAVAASVLVAAALTGCVGEPDPVTTTPGFASEEEAFAAAEQTYRNYVDALNQVDLSDPETFEAMYAWLTGDASGAVRKTYSQMHADGWSITGKSRAALIDLASVGGVDFGSIDLAVCLDVSDIDVLDASGKSVVNADRLDVQPLSIALIRTNGADLKISRINGREGEPSCAE
jgi:hypothetical protein